MNDMDALGLKRRVLCDHDALAARQRLADRLERLAPHDHRLAPGQRLEALEIGADMPGHLIVEADDAVLGHGDDEDDCGLVHGLAAPSFASAVPDTRQMVHSSFSSAPIAL